MKPTTINTLIHVALYSEAVSLIRHFNLRQYETQPFKIFRDDTILLVVSGIGKDNTIAALKQVYRRHRFSNVINFGMAGCTGAGVSIGSLFCCVGQLSGVPILPLFTSPSPVIQASEGEVHLVDMESAHFLSTVQHYQSPDSIWILKVVSDHLDDRILTKEEIDNLVSRSIEQWEGLLSV